MLMTIAKFGFAAISSILAAMIIFGKLFVFRKKHPGFVSDYCATMAGILGLYVFFALSLVWFIPFTSAKLIMLGFAISPFLIGLIVTYDSEKYFSAIQILLFVFGSIYVFL